MLAVLAVLPGARGAFSERSFIDLSESAKIVSVADRLEFADFRATSHHRVNYSKVCQIPLSWPFRVGGHLYHTDLRIQSTLGIVHTTFQLWNSVNSK